MSGWILIYTIAMFSVHSDGGMQLETNNVHFETLSACESAKDRVISGFGFNHEFGNISGKHHVVVKVKAHCVISKK